MGYVILNIPTPPQKKKRLKSLLFPAIFLCFVVGKQIIQPLPLHHHRLTPHGDVGILLMYQKSGYITTWGALNSANHGLSYLPTGTIAHSPEVIFSSGPGSIPPGPSPKKWFERYVLGGPFMRSYHQNIWMSQDICLANDMTLISFQRKFMSVISPNIYVSKFGSQEKKPQVSYRNDTCIQGFERGASINFFRHPQKW